MVNCTFVLIENTHSKHFKDPYDMIVVCAGMNDLECTGCYVLMVILLSISTVVL